MSPDSLIFQSTLSVRRATRHLALAPLVLRISIHALRKESDHLSSQYYPIFDISIHALRKESDIISYDNDAHRVDFNPRSP